MTFRTTVRDGLIIINTHGAVPDGTEVEVALPAPRRKPVKQPKNSRYSGGRKTASRNPVPGFGAWRDRSDIGEGADFVDRLRSDPVG